MMDKEKMREKMRKVVEKMKKDPHYKDIDKELEELGKEPGPYFGPRNDIERQKLYKEIEESGKEDEKDDDQ